MHSDTPFMDFIKEYRILKETVKYFVITVLGLTPGITNAQISSTYKAVLDVESVDVRNSLREIELNTATKLYNEVLKNNLHAYPDTLFRQAYSKKTFSDLTDKLEIWSVPNPLSPDDPYDIIDTQVRTPFNPYEANKFEVNKSAIGYEYKEG